jgi:hypothetical protein
MVGHEPKMPLLPELENLFLVLPTGRAEGAFTRGANATRFAESSLSRCQP